MKHLFFTAALLTMCLSGSAQSTTPVFESTNSSFSIIPKEYSFKQQTNIVMSYYDFEEREGQYEIYDENFNKRKAFTVPMISLGYTDITRMEANVEVSVRSSYHYSEGIYDDIESALLYVGESSWKAVEEDGKYKIVSSTDSYYYYNYDEYGEQYPTRYYIYDPETKALDEYETYYDVKVTYIPGTQTTHRDENSSTIGLLSQYIYDVTGNQRNRELTQTLFNSDSKYEYLAPILEPKLTSTQNLMGYTTDSPNEQTVVGTRETYTMIWKGVKVMDEDGTELNRILFNLEDDIAFNSFFNTYIMDLGTKKYIAVFTGNKFLVYSFDDISTGARLVTMTQGPRVSPTIANRSDMITVELEGENRNGREVSVVNAAGQTVMKTMIPAGQKSTQINASALNQGLNLLNIKGEQGATKIIIK